jgi:polysaccharide biosynthesis transport protein
MTESQAQSGLPGLKQILRRRWWYVATLLPATLFVALLLAFGVQAKYRSTATIILEASSIQTDLISATVTTYADQQIEIVQGRVLTPVTLTRLVHEFDPYPKRTDWSVERKVQELLGHVQLERVDAVTLKRLDKSNAFSLHYLNPDPKLAADTARRLADLFLSYHQAHRTEAAGEATAFLSDRAKAVTEELQALDTQYSQLQSQRGGASPDSADRNRAALERAERELYDAQTQLREAEERESLLAIQLKGLSPTLMAKTGESSGDMANVATVRALLAEAEQKYTPEHPDVLRLKRALQTLIAQGGAVNEGTMVPDNPEYLRVASQLSSAQRAVAALRASVGQARAEISRYSGLIQVAPTAEREFAQLTRRRNVLQEQFQDIQAKLREAQLGQLFETEQRGERFTLVREPMVANQPAVPNRPGIILLGLILGAGLCIAAIAIAESSDRTIRVGDVSSIPGLPLLGYIPPIPVRSEMRHGVRVRLGLYLAYAVAALIVAYAIVT